METIVKATKDRKIYDASDLLFGKCADTTSKHFQLLNFNMGDTLVSWLQHLGPRKEMAELDMWDAGQDKLL